MKEGKKRGRRQADRSEKWKEAKWSRYKELSPRPSFCSGTWPPGVLLLEAADGSPN